MAEFDPNHPPFVVLVFDTRPGSSTMGHVSVNGELWTKFSLKARPGKQSSPEKTGKRVKASDAPPPAEGDDGVECLFCDVHNACMCHIWTGSRWKCLGAGCTGPLCS